MKLYGKGLLITFTQVADKDEADFNEWYNREHLDERIDLPGFRRACRYVAVDAAIKYMSTYECLRPDDIGSPAYLKVLANQTDWSKRVMGGFTKWHRLMGIVVADATHGIGAAATLVRFRPEPKDGDALAKWFNGGVLDAVNRSAGIVGSFAVAGDSAAEARLARGLGVKPDPEIPEWCVLVQGSDLDATLEAAKAHLGDKLGAVAARGAPTWETYRLMFLNERLGDDVLA